MKEFINSINKKFGKSEGWGAIFNYIQNTAEKVLTKKEFNKFLEITGNEFEQCDGQDGQLVNGVYYDWKEFDYKRDEMICGFIDILDKVNSTAKSKVIEKILNEANNDNPTN